MDQDKGDPSPLLPRCIAPFPPSYCSGSPSSHSARKKARPPCTYYRLTLHKAAMHLLQAHTSQGRHAPTTGSHFTRWPCTYYRLTLHKVAMHLLQAHTSQGGHAPTTGSHFHKVAMHLLQAHTSQGRHAPTTGSHFTRSSMTGMSV